jgi:hypothetical protein
MSESRVPNITAENDPYLLGADEEPSAPAPFRSQPPAAPSPEPAGGEADLRRELDETRRNYRTLEERTNLLLQSRYAEDQRREAERQAQEAARQAEAIPALDRDPVGHILGNHADFRRQLQQQQWREQQYNQVLQQQQLLLGALSARGQESERAIVATKPDYYDAVQFLTQRRDRQLEIAGIRNPTERAQIIQAEGLSVVARATQDGGDPAARIYEIAQTYGYEPEAAVPSPRATEQRDRRTGMTPSERLGMVRRGQAQARSLGNARGSSPTGPLTAQRMMEMDYDTFYRVSQTPEGRAVLGDDGMR